MTDEEYYLVFNSGKYRKVIERSAMYHGKGI